MAIKGTRNLNAGARIAIIFGAIGLFGYAWRFFGVIGNGVTVLGLFAALFFIAFWGNRKSVSYESLPLAVALAAATCAPIYSNGLLPHPLLLRDCFLLGFGLLPLFAFWIGTRLSKNLWRFWELIVLTAAFFIIAVPLRLFAAPHFIKDPGVCFAAANAAAALIVFLAAGVWKKDPIASLLPFGLCCAAGLAALAAALLHRPNFQGSGIKAAVLTDPMVVGLISFASFGLLAAIIMVCLPNDILSGEGKFKLRSPIGHRHARWLFDAVFVLFLILLLPVCRLCALFLKLLHWSVLDPRTIIICGILILIAWIICLVIAHKNVIVRCLHVPVRARPEDFALRALPSVVGICVFCDLFEIASEAIANRRLQGGLLPALKLATTLPTILSICAAVLFFLSFAIAAKCVKLHKR